MTKNALILGGTSDVGVAIGYQLAEKGYAITLAGRDQSALREVELAMKSRYENKITSVFFDALNISEHDDFYNGLTHKPDLVICIFGYLGDQKKGQSQWEEAEKILLTNFIGAVSILNVVANDFEKRKNGVLVGISSVAGERGRQSNYLYGSSKAGLTSYLSGLRNRLARNNVHVVTIIPGYIMSKMTKHLKTAPLLTSTPEQVAKSIVKAIQNRKNVVYISGIWFWIALILRNIPEFLFKKLGL